MLTREALAIASASCVYPPLLAWAETAKTVVQTHTPAFRGGVASAAAAIVRRHGVARLALAGIDTSLVREVSYNTSRWMVYGRIREVAGGREQLGFGGRLGCGILAGGLGSFVSNALDQIRVRQQAKALESQFAWGLSELSDFLNRHGVKALWRGWQINLLRAACFTSTSMASYEESKRILGTFMEEGPVMHSLAGLCMGTVGTFAYMPADRIRTAIFTGKFEVSPLGRTAEGSPNLRGIAEIAAHIYRAGGIPSYFKGVNGALLRTVPACMLFPAAMEFSRKLYGLEYF